MNLQYGPYSPSRLDSATCGYAFKRQYIDKDPAARTENLPQARGSAVHLVLEQLTKRMCNNPDAVFSGDEIRKLVVDAISKHPAAYQETDAILHMAQLYVRYPPPLLTRDAGVELHLGVKHVGGEGFVACDYNDPEAFGRGRADIMLISDDTTLARVYDHKTQPNIEEADTFQMGFYAWTIKKTYPFLDTIETVLHFARYGRYSEPYVWTSEDLARFEDDLLTRVAVIESRTSFEATPHKGCQYCPFLAECPAMKEFVEVDEGGRALIKTTNLKCLGDVNKAVKIAGLINVLEEVLKRAKDSLKEHVEAYESPIAIPGKVFMFKASDPKPNWDVINKKLRDDTYKVFEKYGLDPKQFMGFSQTFTDRLWLLENEGLLKDLGALFPMKTETRFAGYKA